MQAHILFITSRYFEPLTRAALNRLAPECRTTVVAYEDFSKIPEIYLAHQDSCDAVMLSGASARQTLQMHFPGLNKPVADFQVDSDALHRDILRYAMDRGSLDFTRIAMDFLVPMDPMYSVADFLEMDDMPMVMRYHHRWMQEEQVRRQGAEELIFRRIVELWEQGTIDSVICMYSGNVPRLQARGIPCRCPFLSDACLRQQIRDVLIKIELQQLHDNHPAIVQIFPLGASRLRQEEGEMLEGQIREFLRSNLLDCMIQRSETCCSIITSLRVARFLTGEFRSCKLWAALKETLDFSVVTAYGIGTTISHAMNNVQLASREAKLREHPYAVDSNGHLVGPMNSAANTVITQADRLQLGEIAARASLSVLTVQKILAILDNRNSDKLTIQDLAQSLDTTVRNANRIMRNLLKGGFAHPVYTQVSHTRGRPVQVYALELGAFPE